MSPTPSHQGPARLDQLPVVLAWAEAFCAQAGVDPRVSLRLQLVLEELFTNTVTHGHGGDSDAPVRIGLQDDGTHLGLSYEDRAPPFDPRVRLPDVAAERVADADQRPVGHLGLVLVLEMASELHHEAVAGGNRLRLRLSKSG